MTTGTDAGRLSIYKLAALAVLAGVGTAAHAAPAKTAIKPTVNVAASVSLPAPAPDARIAANTPVVRVPRGSSWTLPLEGVTRVVPADDDVARGSFRNGRAVIEGVTTGNTTVEVFQGENRRQLFAVQVEDPSSGAVAPEGSVVTPISPSTGAASGESVVIAPGTPVVVAANSGSAALPPATSGPIGNVPGRSNLAVSLRVSPVEDNPSQALFTITFGNRSTFAAQNVVIRSALDDVVSYVTGSATGGARYDSSARELVWNVGTLDAGANGQSVSFRVEPIERGTVTFYSVATIEDASGVPVASNAIKYGTGATPLLTVFALPDRFLAGRNAPVLVDVKGVEYQRAVDRLQTMGIVNGREPGRFYPGAATQRAEYAVMTLNGLNLKDLRDVSAIKFVLGRRSTVSLGVRNSAGREVASLISSKVFQPGEFTAIWDGRVGTGYAPPGRYTYVCNAKDAKGEVTTLKGIITIVPQNPLEPTGTPSFIDVKPSDWYSGYLAVAEKQNLMIGYPGKLFEPQRPISRVEATAVVVRALGLEDMARQMMNQSVGFLDYQNIPKWASGYVNVASTVAKTQTGKLIVGYPSNFFLPMKSLRRDEAALIVQRLIDKETNRRVAVSGQLAPGASVTINSRTVEANDQGEFSFVIEQNTAEPTTVAVIGGR
ncbi:MAG TPA: S-layer homology domain-containing protein [Abditibacteriaceae bacterium]